MSLVNILTRGLIYKDGEKPKRNLGSWHKDKYGKFWVSTRLTDLPIYIINFPIWLFSLIGVRWAQRIIGYGLGYSSCSHCKMPWKYIEGKTIPYSPNSGMFPLCINCFDTLTPEEIEPYIEGLVLEWLHFKEKYGLKWEHEQMPAELIETAKAEMRKMKASD